MFMKQDCTPLYTAMKTYIEDKAMAFHTPGHKQGKGADRKLHEMITDMGLKMEVSLMEELDDIHGASTCIKAAQDLARDLYGADESRFFINGTTGAIQAMILTAVNPGDKIIIPRNAHRSVLGALVLAGAKPVFIQPEIDETLGIAMSITPKELKRVIEKNTDAKAVVMVYPTYYGVAGDIQTISKLVHENNMLLLVDEAHGPHLKFSKELPIQALDAGADIVAQSTHKILGSMTQTSLLHMKKARVSVERFNKMCSLVQSTSPNYLLMASLDIARKQMAVDGEKLVNRAVILAEKLREEINKIPNLNCFGKEYMNSEGKFALDVTKITVCVRDLGISGAVAEQVLRHKYKIQCELSDMYNLLFIISYADSEVECNYLLSALKNLAKEYQGKEITPLVQINLPQIPEYVLSPREAMFRNTKSVAFLKSVGKIAGEMITFYPPGIPVIYPGERINQEIIDYVLLQKQNGGNIIGPEDTSLENIQIVEE